MRSEQEVGLWRMVLGVVGVTALGWGVSLQLEAASRPVHEPVADNASSAATHAAATPLVKPAAANRRPRRAPTDAETRVKAGTIPAGGLRVVSTTYVDYRNDQGTRLRRAGKLIGPMPGPGQMGGVAGGCNPVDCTGGCPGQCSFTIHCDDSNPCTVDRCDFIAGSAACTGTCVNDPVADGESGGCDDGKFCNGKETCQGAVCAAGSLRNVGLACDAHAFCGEAGTCNIVLRLCSAGKVGDACNTDEDCSVVGRCQGGPYATNPCDSDADCVPGTCNILGTCTAGTCTTGAPAICCSDPANPTVCADVLPRCDASSENHGVVCEKSSDCKGGLCERCQPSCTTNADCADGRRCNGDETCLRTCAGGTDDGKLCPPSACPGGSCLGQCEPGVNPCGAGALCIDKRCGSIPPLIACNTNSDCDPTSPNYPCVDVTPNPPGLRCFLGRCCKPGANPAQPLTCAQEDLNTCKNTPGAIWYSGDGGEQDTSLGCGGENPQSHEPWECPKYTSGLTQLNAANPPIYPMIVGPISDSAAAVPLPCGPGMPLNQLGDDYSLFNAGLCIGGTYNGQSCRRCSLGAHAGCDSDAFCASLIPSQGTCNAIDCAGGRCGGSLDMDVMRFAGVGFSGGDRLSVDFYDDDGNFVEDIVLDPAVLTSPEPGINVVIFTPPLTIPSRGWVVIRAAEDFSPNARFGWLSTTAAAAGTNNPNALWINSYPGLAASVNNNFLKMCAAGPRQYEPCLTGADCPSGTCDTAPGIMVFEIVGDKVVDPTGACCAPDGECVDGALRWVCENMGHVYHGDGTLCASCNGGPNAGNTCLAPADCPPSKVCVGGGNPGAPCPLGTECQGGVCTVQNTCGTGNIGAECGTLGLNPECDVEGLCGDNLTCDAGKLGQVCAIDDDCDVLGTCVAVACQPIVECANGACCDPATGDCSLAMGPGACSGTWFGYGTDCEPNCCEVPYYPDLRCMSGPNNLQTCTVDTECRFCVGGSHNGETCTTTSAPDGNPGGCLNEGVCTAGACVGGLPPNPNICLTDVDCPDNSGFCRGRCVIRGTGGDNCMDAYVHVITVPTLAEGPKTITISGNNLAATSTEEEPDGCFGPMVLANDDPAWFEAFSVDICARVRIDFCCSDPHRQPAYTFLYPDGTCQDPISSAPDPYTAGQSDAGQGTPYCDDDNTWATFPFLQAGTYYYPIFSALAGAHGTYQMHITVEACPTAACCYLACSIGGQHCDENTPCPGGAGTCVSNCEELNQGDCDAKLGFFLAPPHVSPIVPQCAGSPCAEGSCCTGPGLCKDQRQNFGQPMTQAACEQDFNGIFVGGVDCYGGTCSGGPDNGLSCSPPLGQNCAVGGTCIGSATQLAQANPCPVCVIKGSGNCQAWDNSPQMSPSDLGTGSGEKMADDFILTQNGSLTDVCVWGLYFDNSLAGRTDCGGPELPIASQWPDTFRVRVYEDDGGKPGGGNCTNAPFQWCFLNSECPPGGTCLLAPLGESTCTRTKAVIPGAASEGTVWGGKTWSFQLSLDNPIPNLLAAKCYWLEVTNDTPDAVFGEKCTWHWSQLAEDSTQGNLYSAAGSEVNGYDAASQRPWDMAWCLNLSVAPGGCASQPKTCCSCQNVCTTSTLSVCDDASGVWHEGDASCPTDCGPPLNDNCVDVTTTVPVGLYSVSTQCATTDGGNPVGGRADTTFQQDVWYFFRPSEDCPLRADGCTSSQNVFDSVIAIYHDANDPTQCVCPLDRATSDRTLVDASNDDCVILGAETGGIVETDALAGHCYTIRFAGVPGKHPVGRSAVEISCGPPKCGDQRRNGAEQCDGLDNENCRTASPSTLCKPDCTCGAPNPCGNGTLETGEECDPNRLPTGCVPPSPCRPPSGPLQCTCVPFCGNDNIEDPEECDGTDDAVCPGRCEADCTCPPLVCGNGRLEPSAGEECEFGKCVFGGANCTQDSDCTSGACDKTADRADCESGNCRPPGDPLGGCTCACPTVAPPPGNIVWDSSATSPDRATRSLRFRVDAPVTATGLPGQDAIKVTMVDLQNPVPPNAPCCPPPNFGAFESATCTAAGEGNGCARWVGRPGTFYEAQDDQTIGEPYRAARLQCTPFYFDWITETATNPITVVGAEILPSSTYLAQTYGSSCEGSEGSCSDVGSPVTMFTRRSGDVWARYNPPSTARQPDGIDIVVMVSALKKCTGAPTKAIAQIQPNLPELNLDVDLFDIVRVYDAFNGLAYPFSGPCPCPSLATCGARACTSATVCTSSGLPGLGPGSLCVKTCGGGPNDGEPCLNGKHCGNTCATGPRTGLLCNSAADCLGAPCTIVGTCGSGFCRDRCGRCTP